MRRQHTLVAVCCGVLFTSSVIAQEIVPLEPELAQRYGKLLSDRAAQVEKPQVVIKADSSKSVGVRIGRDAIVLVPHKDLKEGKSVEEYGIEMGGPVAYLFTTPTLLPMVDGKPVASNDLRTVPLPGREGDELSTNFLILAARQISDDEWRLLAYGSDRKPLFDTKFTQAEDGDEKQTVTLSLTDSQPTKGTIVVTLFGKYQAGFDVTYLGD